MFGPAGIRGAASVGQQTPPPPLPPLGESLEFEATSLPHEHVLSFSFVPMSSLCPVLDCLHDHKIGRWEDWEGGYLYYL